MSLTAACDWLLDRSVVPGYTRLGYRLRRHWWPADPPPGALAGKHVAVTGANSGLGRATTLGLATLGAEVRMLCRDRGRGEDAAAQVAAQLPHERAAERLHVDVCDVSDLDALRGFARDFVREVPVLHALVHNAGVLPPERTESAQGHELTLATHVLGPHLLTGLLREPLAADGDARVVFVASGGMYAQRLHMEDPEYTRGEYSGTTAYARTKRMQVLLAERWARELRSSGVSVHSMHPGWADTPGVQTSLPGFHRLLGRALRTDAEGADTTVWLAAAEGPGRATGRFWHDRAPRPTSYLPLTRASEEDVDRLWRFCVDSTGVPEDVTGPEVSGGPGGPGVPGEA